MITRGQLRSHEVHRPALVVRVLMSAILAAMLFAAPGSGRAGPSPSFSTSSTVAESSIETVPTKAIAAGFRHSCAVTDAGAVKCWGWNESGRLGDGTTTDRLTPVDVAGLSGGVRALAAGGAHTCAVTDAGTVKCWGYNGVGELGDGTTTERLTPVDVTGLGVRARSLAVGAGHSCALTSSGRVKCWGANGAG